VHELAFRQLFWFFCVSGTGTGSFTNFLEKSSQVKYYISMQVGFSTQQTQVVDRRVAEHNILLYEHKARNARITALALCFISLFLFTAAFVLWGMGTLSPTFMMGLGIFPYLGGALLSYIALAVHIGMLAFAAIALVRTCQRDKWQAIITRLSLEGL
jgi:hypothetical protein